MAFSRIEGYTWATLYDSYFCFDFDSFSERCPRDGLGHGYGFNICDGRMEKAVLVIALSPFQSPRGWQSAVKLGTMAWDKYCFNLSGHDLHGWDDLMADDVMAVHCYDA
jgi:hypothetical protein